MRIYPVQKKVVPYHHTPCFIVWQKNPQHRLSTASDVSLKFIARTICTIAYLLSALFNAAIKGSSFFHSYLMWKPEKSRTWSQKWQLTANPNWDWLSWGDYLMIKPTSKNSFLPPPLRRVFATPDAKLLHTITTVF